jgi:hypothetical protein
LHQLTRRFDRHRIALFELCFRRPRRPELRDLAAVIPAYRTPMAFFRDRASKLDGHFCGPVLDSAAHNVPRRDTLWQ